MGHIINLCKRGIKNIFMPCVAFEVKENKNSDNHYNCSVVQSYPELIAVNIDMTDGVKFIYPYFNLEKKDSLARILAENFSDFSVNVSECVVALKAAFSEQELLKEI
jgi:predicted nucleotide-binding protein (sugar kinase/HSP70/actin superfamily)